MKFDTKTIVPILTSIFIIYFLYRAYTYLGDLKSCACSPNLYANRLKTLESIYIALYGLGIVTALFSTTLMKLIRMNGKIITSIFLVALLTVYLLFIYNVYEFQNNLDSKCGCAIKWSRIIIYVQAILYAIPLLFLLLGVIFGLSNLGILIVIVISVLVDIFYFQKKIVPPSTSTIPVLSKSELSKTPDVLLNAPMPM